MQRKNTFGAGMKALFALMIMATFLSTEIIWAQQPSTATDETQLDRRDVVSLLEAEGSYTWFVSALRRTGLDVRLEGQGPFTILAPTDSAIENSGIEHMLVGMAGNELAELLKNHLLDGEITQENALELGSLVTMRGEILPVSKREGVVRIAGAEIVAGDLLASNGVAHGISAVLAVPDEIPEPQGP